MDGDKIEEKGEGRRCVEVEKRDGGEEERKRTRKNRERRRLWKNEDRREIDGRRRRRKEGGCGGMKEWDGK